MNENISLCRGLFTFITFFIFLSTIAFVAVCSSNTLDGELMRNISNRLSEDFDILRREELGIDFVMDLYSTFKYTTSGIDANNTVNQISRKLQVKIEDIFSALSQAKSDIEKMQILNNATHSSLFPCLPNNSDNLTQNEIQNNENLLLLYSIPKNQLKIDYILHKMKSKIWTMKNDIKQHYFLSSYDVNFFSHSLISDCNLIDHTLLWKNYMARNNYVPKNIVLLLDHGGSLSNHHFYVVKLIAKQVIASLNEGDNLALLAISNIWSTPDLSDECSISNQVLSNFHYLPNLTSVNSNKRKILNSFIDGITKGIGATNHSLGLEKAFTIMQKNQVQNETVMILYISRGLLSSLTEVKSVLETISNLASNLSCSFIINTCAVIDETRPTIYETQFLEDLANQNYKKYNLSYSHPVQSGTMVAINSSESIGFAISRFFGIYNKANLFVLKPGISYPTWDHISSDLTITFSTGCCSFSQCGVLGIDAYFSHFAEDILYFNHHNKKHCYIFLIDLNGRAIIHPMFASLTTARQQLHFTDISHFEPEISSDLIKNRLLKEAHGFHQILHLNETIRYTWSQVKDWFVVCLVTRNLHKLPKTPHLVNWPYNKNNNSNNNNNEDYPLKLVYQNLDYSSTDDSKFCRHLNQIARLDAGSLFLSSSCFKSKSSTFLKQIQNPDLAENYMTYLQDNTNRVRNPGLKDAIKDEVAALAHILNYLRSQHLTGFKSKYIVRRYVCSYSGVLEMFPGSILEQNLDPTKRAWFIQATEHKFKVTLIPPYLDEGGAGYIVTVAYATQHVVVAIDITYGYVFRMLLKRMPFCTFTNITCFLMDDRGYLIYHPNLIDPNGHGPVEKQHIVHKESLVASDILNNKFFINKFLCNSYGDGTIQRYYKLNSSYNQVLVSSVQGENCVNYNIAAIPNSNIFVGLVNATCNVVVTFCPCSIVDRLCLNCNRMEPKECECPCECPILEKQCIALNPLCTWFPEHVSFKARFQENGNGNGNGNNDNDQMQSCFPASCHTEKTHYRCLGLTGCEWCKFDVDGSLLKNPFCASMATCFNGVVGSITPYNNYAINHIERQEIFNVPVSFIAVLLIVIIIILISFYFYNRSNHHVQANNNERLYLSSTQDNNLRMSDLNLSDNYHTVGNHRDKLLQDEKPDPLSPYCVSSGYRKTFFAADSDHGYSTMTQHDESEHMSLAPVELDSLEDDLDLGSDNLSTQTNLSGKPQALAIDTIHQTCIPQNQFIIVPVTVHRNKETT